MKHWELLFLGFCAALDLPAQTGKVAVVSLSSYVRQDPNSTSPDCYHAEKGDTLVLASEENFSNYYLVQAPGGCSGYVYRNRVRLRISAPPTWAEVSQPSAGDIDLLKICSFNIKWLGFYSRKDHRALADLLAPYDIVVIQELTSAPRLVEFPNGDAVNEDPESREFFELMHGHGFRDALSSENTGKNSNHSNTTAAEWFVAFYRDDVVAYDPAQSGFVHTPLTHNTVFDRVPWAFHFSAVDASLDFSLISVHLKAEASLDDERRAELAFIAEWAANAPGGERDHIILGDMNIQSANELGSALPPEFSSLNASSLPTNTGGGKPYDHVMYKESETGRDLDKDHGFVVLDLVDLMRGAWSDPALPYPGQPYSSTLFPQYYSDHNPVVFQMKVGQSDDD